MKWAIIDLGSNTFHLLIVEQKLGKLHTIWQEATPAKIAQGGINQGIITPEAIQRALNVLKDFRAKIDELGIDSNHIKAIGTSAIRNAKNNNEFCTTIATQTGIHIDIISGEREAELIYGGVRQATHLGNSPNLIMDIGGGSVEFIIANQEKIFWKKSFEIGGQRLLEKFVNTDPISEGAIRRIYDYLQIELLPLMNAAHQYRPQVLVGSSGSFDTLIDIEFMRQAGHWPPEDQHSFAYNIEAFKYAYNLIVGQDREKRMQIKGMKELRVDMIVVGVIMIDYVLEALSINEIRCSTFALKEGILNWVVNSNQEMQYPYYV